jgi:hypothetical protein
MTRDPIELDLATGTRARRGRRSPSRKSESAADASTEQTVLASSSLDEAFALFASDESHARPADATSADNDLQSAACEALSDRGMSAADKRSLSQLSTPKRRIQQQRNLVDNLSAQLAALDRQREHLAQLLQDIDAATLVDRLGM